MAEGLYGPWVRVEIYKLLDGAHVLKYEQQEPIAVFESRQSTNPDNLRISFQVENYGFSYPNFGYATIILHNADRFSKIGQAYTEAVKLLDPEFITTLGIRLRVGYESWECPEVIYSGFISEILDSYQQPNDKLRLFCQFLYSFPSRSFTIHPDAPLIQVVADLFEAYFNEDSCPFSAADVIPARFKPVSITTRTMREEAGKNKPFVYTGTVNDWIYQIDTLFNVNIQMSATSFLVFDTKNNETTAVEFDPRFDKRIRLSYKSGLIGSPSFYTSSSQVSFQSVLNPRFDYNTLFELQDIGPTINGPTGTVINIANSRLFCAQGFPKIYSHVGDTRGPDWYTQVTGWLVDGIYAP